MGLPSLTNIGRVMHISVAGACPPDLGNTPFRQGPATRRGFLHRVRTGTGLRERRRKLKLSGGTFGDRSK
jgi:hypothetical protein